MEDYEYKVINLHATYSKIISKSTSNTSKNTSKSSLFTQGTAALFGGCFEMFSRFVFGDQMLLMPLVIGQAAPRIYTYPLPYRATTPLPAASPTFTGLYRRFTDFSDFLGRTRF